MELGQRECPARRFTSNAEVFEAWHEHNQVRLRPITLRNYGYEIQKFMESWGNVLVTQIAASDFRNYLGQFSNVCQNLTRRNKAYGREQGDLKEPWCAANMDLAGCGAACPKYGPMNVTAVMKHLNAVNTLYDFMVYSEIVDYNFVRDIRRVWIKGNSHRAKKTPKRVPTKEEVERLINKSPYLYRRVIYLLMAKTGLRISEVVHLSINPEFYRPRDGWIKIPEFGGKRRGSRIVIVDAQLLSYLVKYERWRERKLARLGKINSSIMETDRLFINHQGRPFQMKHGNSTFNRHMIWPDAVRSDIMTEGAPRADRLTTHGFRHFFSDYMKKQRIGDFWWNTLRGDIPKGNERTYVHLGIEDIRKVYLEYAPQFIISPP